MSTLVSADDLFFIFYQKLNDITEPKLHDVMCQGAPVSPPQDPHGALLLGAAHRPLLAHHGIAAGP